ncbi:GNAT family N-acetyltransferase [Actinoplanes bogorensis]|uniref:GNAT family N-acetyltransferase n=1 Tax=Paractinoplanes bogorensis TaxID=1610840 RepID=A0ABS5YS84_9ACTN|nr:GNAT family N-acetyltransferase [Actinoplanes bogorensis]MBU2666311.1 GNAT family N-acetyltransferase [Actinoplanes bogorensis]
MTIILPAAGSGTGLLLRPWRPADMPALVVAHQDPALGRHLRTSLADEGEARQWLDVQDAGWAAATRFSFAVVADVDDHSPLAHVAVTVGDAGTAEVGYWTAAHARGQGVAARALETVSRWALATQEIMRLDLFHSVDNPASCRVALKSGYPLRDLLPAAPPDYPRSGHRHVRQDGS